MFCNVLLEPEASNPLEDLHKLVLKSNNLSVGGNFILTAKNFLSIFVMSTKRGIVIKRAVSQT